MDAHLTGKLLGFGPSGRHGPGPKQRPVGAADAMTSEAAQDARRPSSQGDMRMWMGKIHK